MTEEVREELAPAEEQEVVTNEQDTSEADFAAGFAEAMGEEPPEVEEKTQEPTAEPVAEEVKQEPAQETPPPPTPEELIAQAKAEIYQELARVRDTSAGRIGEVNQRMQQLLSQQQSTGQSGVKLTKESLKRLNAEFGEMAEMLAEDLSEAFQGFSGGPAQIDQSVIDRQVTERVAAVEDKLTKNLERFKLSTLHSDWESVVTGESFRTWLSSKPPSFQEHINQSWDAQEIASAISSYKQEAEKAQRQAQQRKSRLEAAVTPTQSTQAAPAVSEADEFAAGFFKIAGKR